MLTAGRTPAIPPSVGRPKINDEQTPARFKSGTLERIDRALSDKEKRSDFIREAVERELERREKARDAIAVAEAIKSDTKADLKANAASTQAAQDRAEAERKLTDAVASAPDSVPDAVVVQYGCEQLRQAGFSVADLPACVPPGGRPPACSKP